MKITQLSIEKSANQQQLKPVDLNRLTLFALFILMVCHAQATTLFRLKLTGPANSSDETVIYYQQNATDGFDSQYDSYKLIGPNPSPHIAQQYGSTLMQINGINPVLTSFSIQIRVTTNITGNFVIKTSDVQELPAGTVIYLVDRYTKDSINILTNTCSFTLSDTTYAARFILYIKGAGPSQPTAIKQQVKQAPRLGNLGDNSFVLAFDEEMPVGTKAELLTPEGRIVKQYDDIEKMTMLDFKAFQSGIYILKIACDTQSAFCFKVLLH